MKRSYGDPAYSKWRKTILKRDKRVCKMPSCRSRLKLQVHHIRMWATAHALRYEPSNGITLCKKCHMSIRGKESHYEALFMEIVHGLS